MSNRLWVTTVIVILLVINVYPIYQLVTTGGYLFYTNATDEAHYLQYDFSQATQGLSRIGQYPVTLAHQVGLSAGWINFIFDILAFTLFLLCLRGILKLTGLSDKNANTSSVLIATLPLVFGQLNPLFDQLNAFNLSSGLVYWVTMPATYFLQPILRSPEPQISLLIVSFAIYISLKWRSFIPAYLCIPFLYPFIGIPFAFVLLSIHLYKAKLLQQIRYPIIFPLVVFVILALALSVYFNVILPEDEKDFLVNSRFPLFSVTAFCSILLYLVFYKKIETKFRYPLLVIALAPLVAANHQIVSGWIAVPKNFEDYYGVYAICIVLVFASYRFPTFKIVLGVLGVVAVLTFGYKVFQRNYDLNHRLVLNDELLHVLQTNSQQVAINNPELASVAGMIFPRQPLTTFAHAQMFHVLAQKYLPSYLCAKQQLLKKSKIAYVFRSIFSWFDDGYKYEREDYIYLHLGRKDKFELKNDPGQMPTTCPPENYFIVMEGREGVWFEDFLNVYTSPDFLPKSYIEKLLDSELQPLQEASVIKADMVTIKPNQIIVEGEAEKPQSYLVRINERSLRKGSYFVAQGIVYEGGVHFGLIRDGQWVERVNIADLGQFTAIMQVPEDGQYILQMGNYTVGDSTLDNHFIINKVGWVEELINVYTAPTDLAFPAQVLTLPLTSFDISSISSLADMVTIKPNQIIVEGEAEKPQSYLVRINERSLRKGSYFVAQGIVYEGGVHFGLIRDGQWVERVNIADLGQFTAIMQVPEDGQYILQMGNYLRESVSLENNFVITKVGLVE